MELFRQLVSVGQNLQPTTSRFYGGFVLTSLLSLFFGFHLHFSGFSGNAVASTCDNVTSGGEIGEGQSSCGGFDPELIYNVESPSGGSGSIEYVWLKSIDCSLPVNEWDEIPGATGLSYDPGFISETTCFIRCSRREGCIYFVGESNIITIEVTNDCADEDWEFDCGEGKKVELIGKGIKNNIPFSLNFEDVSSIYQIVIEIVYKGGNPGSSVSIYDEFGIPYIAHREQPVGGSSSVYVYRTILPSTSSVSYQNQSQENKAQSIVAYLFRNDSSGSQSSGYFTHISGYHDVQTLHFTIPADLAPRNIDIELPVSEMTPDCRILNITATAGGVSEMITIDGPDDDLGCCLNIAYITLANVPGSVTDLEIEVESPSGSGSGCPSTPDHNGQSYVIAGAVKVDVECVCPLAIIDVGADHCVDNPSVFSTENLGAGYDYTWNFGSGAQPQTASGTGPHYVSYLDPGIKTVNLSINNDTCSASTTTGQVIVEDCEDTECGLISVTVEKDADCYEVDGILDVEVCETCGTQYPITVFYRYNGIQQQAGPFDSDGPILTELAAGIYSDIYVEDSAGCISNHVGPVVIESNGTSGTTSTETCGSTSCTITGYKGAQGHRAFWIPGLPGVENVRYNFDSNQGVLEVFEDGTARLTGRITNLDDSSCGFDIDLQFVGKRSWTEWSALGRSWKGNASIVGTLYETWDYYEIQDGSTLTGFGCFDGMLNITHKPADYYYGVQIGQAANAKNELPGISAWFFYTGILNGQNYSGSGDINAEGTCGTGNPGNGPETPVLSCPPCMSLDCSASLDPEEHDQLEIPFISCDNADAYSLTYEDSSSGGCPVVITRTWTASGPAGTATCIQEITLLDTAAPVLGNVPADVTVECDDIPAPGNPEITDNCDENVQVSFEESSTQTNTGECSDNSYTITRTWIATDACGNTISESQTITVEDNSSPVFFDIPDDITVTVLPAPDPVEPGVTDNCGNNGDVDVEYSEIVGNGCSYTIERSWTATDNCGNQEVATQTVYVELGPQAGTMSIDGELSCLAPAGNGNVSATPDGNANIPTGFETIFILSNENTGIIEQINALPEFMVSTAGNYAIHILVYVDNPADPNYLDLSAIQLGLDHLSAIENQLEQGGGLLCGALDGSGASVIVDNCNAAIGDFVWEDKNGNGLQDDGEPGLVDVPVSLVGKDITDHDVFLTTNTSPDGFYSFDNLPPGEYKVTFGLIPGYQLTFNNEGGDDTIDSDADPLNGMTDFVTLHSGETNRSLDAGLYVPVTIGDYAWLDCDKDGVQDTGETGLAYVPVTLSGTNGIGNPVNLNTSTDVNGYYEFTNLKPGIYMLTFGFPANPSGLAFAPAGQTSDDLDSDADETTGETPEENYESGETTHDIDVGFMDITDPVLLGVPDDITVACDAVPAPPVIYVDITATDNLDSNVEITFSETSTQGSGDTCTYYNYTITRSWTALDDCGNGRTLSQIITVEDITGPVLTEVPADITVDCHDVPAEANPLATDNCDDDVDILYTEDRIDGNCVDTYTLVRKWRSWDDCNNETVEIQTITVQDTEVPTISGIPDDITVECDNIPVPAIPNVFDNCADYPDMTYDEVRTDGDCADAYTLTRTWMAIDNCGNQNIETRVITVNDTTAPELAGIPADLTVECDAVPFAASPTATDNCDTYVEIIYDEIRTDGNCSDHYMLTRTWTATDNCGNQDVQIQIITVEDTTVPELAGVPVDFTVNCDFVPPATDPFYNDNCDPDADLDFTEVVIDQPCEDTYTLLRTWTVTDNCGNQTSESQTILVQDVSGPQLAGVPGDITVECDAVPAAADPTATDNCDSNVDISYNEIRTDGSCVDHYTLTRTWIAVDNCGNQDVQMQTITVLDTENPELSGVPLDLTVECDAIPVAVSPSATDNCDTQVEISFNEIRTDGFCEDSYMLIRSWTAMDNCGNTTTEMQIITVQDTQAPELAGIPADVTVECNSVPPVANLTATDNCDSNVEISFSETRIDGLCPDTYTLIRTWTATDNCGNTDQGSQSITVQDTTEPVLSGAPADLTVECDAVPAAPEIGVDIIASDNCDQDVYIAFYENEVPGPCENSYSIVRSWIATDNCGNTDEASQVITVQDTTEPVLSAVPGDMTVECDAVPPAATPAATDNCDTHVEIIYSETRVDGNCIDHYILTRTWTATDNCGNQEIQSQTITVEDTTDPELSGVPGDVTVECDAVPQVAAPEAWDNCDTHVEIAYSETRTDGNCSENYTLTRTWTATDNCGNQDVQTQVITVEDTTHPELAGIPVDVTVECDAVPSAASPTATDNCDTNVEITYSETRTDGNCSDNYTLTRTWTAVDDCGNQDIQTQIITIEDTTAPELAGVPNDFTVNCDFVPPPAEPFVNDNCDTDVELDFDEIRTDGPCEDTYTLLRTWTATDNCGNQTSESQTILVQDVTAPQLSGVPADITVECDAVPSVADPIATDNCDTDIEIEYDEIRTDGNCSDHYTLTRTWTAIDNCGNQDVQTQIITVEDTTDPILAGIPGDITVECDAIPSAASPTATDNCDVDVEIVLNETEIPGTCPDTYTLIRTWTATDNCGNTTDGEQIITVLDTEEPTLSGTPSDVTVECNAIPQAPVIGVEITATDNCDSDVLIGFYENEVPGPCENSYSIVRSWIATDNCGNTDEASQVITVVDTHDPVLTGVPVDVTVECDAIPQPASPTATDNCDTSVEIEFDEVQTDGNCQDSYILTRTWTATDNCGNSESQTQVITVEDTTEPVLSGIPANEAVDCGAVPPVVNPTATDNCDLDVEIAFEETETPGPCSGSYILTRTWTATDNCGNSTTQSQVISVEDATPPVLSGVPADLTVECDAIPDPASPIATDNCDAQPEVELSELVLDGDCTDNYILKRIWTATDDCGNFTSLAQLITVEDTTDPVLSGVPANITVECDAVPGSTNPAATDNCDTQVEIIYEESRIDGPCEDTYTLIRTWTALDNCGNTVTHTQKVEVEDTTAPVLTGVPADATVECDAVPAPPGDNELVATDNCDTDVNIFYSESLQSNGCQDNYTILRIWTATDNCGNETSLEQTITVEDTTAPVLSGVPADTNAACDEIPDTPQIDVDITATDNCDINVQISFNELITEGDCGDSYVITRIWTAEDNCGNVSEASQTITVGDDAAPAITDVPADLTVECGNVPAPTNPEANDSCDDNVDITLSETTVAGDCADNYTIIRIWTATDNCGNAITATQTITVEDTEQPVLSGTPSDITVECGDVPPPPMPESFIATDNCDTEVEITFSENQIDGDCQDSYTLIRTWTATDNCGNAVENEQVITVTDSTDPILIGVPADLTVECDNIPDPAVIGVDIVATDNCDTNAEIQLSENSIPGPCIDSYELIRTWTATDNCGNSVEGSQVITVQDTTDPELLGVPADVTLNPGEVVPDPPGVLATDNCDDNVDIFFTESEETEGCTTTITRTWEAIDNCGNSVQESQIIIGTDILNVFITPVNPMICAGDVIEFSSNQVDPGYTYEWTGTGGSFDDPSSMNPVYTNEIPGTYEITLTVSSGVGCEGAATTTVTVFDEPVASAASNSPVCEGSNILLFASGGTSYFWTGPNGFTSFEQNPLIENASLTNAGIYTVMVMTGDCGNEASVEVVVTEGITADFNVVDADCDNTGSINIGAVGGSGVYTYDWADLPGNNDPEDRDELAPGSYSVTIFDSGGCVFVIDEIIVGEDCGCTATAGGITIDADPVCKENGTALITAMPDGTAVVPTGYSMIYLLSNGAGLTIIDLNNDPEFTVSETGVFSIHPFVYNPVTFDIGVIQFGVTTIFDIHFLLQQGGGTICGGLNIPGAFATVSEAVAAIDSTSPAGCDLCNGMASLSPGAYLYEWSDGGSGPARDNLCPGTYEVTATDTNTGCTDILTLAIEEDCECVDPVVGDIQVFDADCGAANGAVNITMTGDEADYAYEWWPNIGSANSIGNNRAELISGIYAITITDLDMPDCSTVLEIVVGNNGGPQDTDVVTENADCGQANGSTMLFPDDYTYTWVFDQLQTNSRDDLLPGIYQVVVIDPQVPDCPEFITVEIGDDSPLQAEAQIIALPACNEANGVVKINISGNTGTPSFNWSDNPGLDVEFRTDLGVGEYFVIVTDNETGCSATVDFYLSGANGGAEIEIVSLPIVLCAGDAFGSADYTVTYSQDFEFPATEIIENANGDQVANGQLGAGAYCISVYDAGGCLAGQNCFDVTGPAALTSVISIQNADCQNGGFIDLDISGGVGLYSYNWLDLPGVDDPQDRDDLLAGNYSVTVIDENGCKLILDDLLVGDDCVGCTATPGGIVADVNPACLENGSASITATPDGTAVVPVGYTTIYLLSNGAGLTIIDANTTPGFIVAQTGSYAVHPLVYNPATFDINSIVFGTTTIFDVHFTLIQGGGTICGGLNIPGASIIVNEAVASIENITPDECEACIGAVSLSPATYLYQWSDGGSGSERTNLCDGSYEVTATDTNTGCMDVLTVIVGDLCNPPCPIPDTIYTSLPIFDEVVECVELENCFDAGETSYLLLDGTTEGNSVYGIWELGNNGCLSYESGGLADNFVDTICVVAAYGGLSDTTCIIVSITDQPMTSPEIDTIYLTTLEETPIDTCLTLDELNGNFASNEVYYEPVNGTGVLDLDTDDPCLIFTPNPGEIGDFIDTMGVIICDDLGVCDTTIVIVTVLPDAPCEDLYSGSDTLSINDCDTLASVCLEIPLDQVLNYTVSDNGMPYTDGYLGCDFDSLITYLAIGFSDSQPYALDWTVNGSVLTVFNFNSLQELVDTMNVLDPNADWALNGTLIVGGDFSNIYGDMVVSFNGTVVATANPNVQLVPNGVAIQLDTGYHEVILTNVTTGCIDTFKVTITCPPITGMSTDTMLTIFEGSTDTLCLDVSGLGMITSIANICPDDSDGNVAFALLPGTACFEYTGEILGQDTFCIEVCDATLNICDTANVIIEVLPDADTIETEILLGFSDTLCLDTSLFANDIGVFFNYCFTAEGPFIEYELDENNYCVYYTGIDIGTDTLCMVLCDLMGACDTTVLIVDVNSPGIDTIYTSVEVGETDTLCVDTTELAGSIVSIDNYCENLSGTFVDFDIVNGYCVSYEGLLPDGTETACLVICDEFGFCDTTILITTVVDNPLIEPPVAVDDDTTGLSGTTTEISILANDTLNGTLIDIGIIDGPANGSVVINPEFTITYLPDPDFCEGVDSFTYYITTPGGTDTATVYIDVLCQELTVFSGMSPNEDGINDYFAILGIEAFPDNTVYIFNRWGNQVYEKEGYTNDDPWYGTWKNSQLPDGTYFYFIEARGSDGKLIKLNGYLQIHR